MGLTLGRGSDHPRGKGELQIVFADINFGDLVLLIVEVFLLVIWIWILFAIIADLFLDHEMSGWGKAIWIVFLVFIPFVGAIVYLIARGSGTRRPGSSGVARVVT